MGEVAASARQGGRTAAIAVFLLAAGTAWSAGNVGAAVGPISNEFEISLASVGLLSATLFLGFSAIGTIAAPKVVEKVGTVQTMIAASLLATVGNLIFAVGDSYAVLAVARAVTGVGLGLAVVSGPVFARQTGGVRQVALFGAAIQLGIAGSLGVGALMVDADLDWRLTFLVSAAVAFSVLPFLRGHGDLSYEPGAGEGFMRHAIRDGRAWRLAALFIAIFSVPLILGTWLVHYLSVNHALAAATAGALSFVLFGISAAAREAGGALAERGVKPILLVGVAPWLAAAGLAILAVDDTLGFAIIAVVAAGIGFALPYGPGIIQAQKLYPSDPTKPVALMSMIGTVIPVLLVPLIGSLLDDGDGTEVFLALAVFVAIAGALNLHTASPQTGEGEGS